MLLFSSKFHEGLKDGRITLTFRTWPKSHVKEGGRYRCHPIGVLLVTGLSRVTLESLSEQDALAAGFESVGALMGELKARTPELSPQSELYRVALRYEGDGDRSDNALETVIDEPAFEKLDETLRKYDEKAGSQWVQPTLAIIESTPKLAASKLAKALGRETASFKADVVKLKKLGLTMSFEVGYEVSPRGKAYLAKKRGNPTR